MNKLPEPMLRNLMANAVNFNREFTRAVMQKYKPYMVTNGMLHDDAYDCSEIAEDVDNLLQAQGGVILKLTPNKGYFFNVVEYGEVKEYMNHYVYVLNNVVFDPRFYPKDLHDLSLELGYSGVILYSEYMSLLASLNQQKGIQIVVTEE